MKLLVTGAKGFVGKNLCAELKNQGYSDLVEVDKETNPALLESFCKSCDFVFHLAGVNRSDDPQAFFQGNLDFTAQLLHGLEQAGNKAPVVLSSSIQAGTDSPYGKSKLAGEQALRDYAARTGAAVRIYRFPNLFGKWCRPHYNSVVATFCHNLARGLPIRIDNPEKVIPFAYIDDVVKELIRVLRGGDYPENGFGAIPCIYRVRLREVADLLESFSENRKTLTVPDLSNPFIEKLYATYLSYLPEDGFSYPLHGCEDSRGSFTEFLRTSDRGQVSINKTAPGVTKGQHWHHTKHEKFLVVSGSALVRLRRLGTQAVLEYKASGERLTVIDIPPGYTHSIQNTGETELVTVMWASQPYDPENPDTYCEPV